MSSKFKLFLSFGLLAATVVGCGEPGGNDAVAPAGSGGGKADDADGAGVCEETGCAEGYEVCRAEGGIAEDCTADFARCLAVEDPSGLLDCSTIEPGSGVFGDDRETCEACDALPQCESPEDGGEVNACLASIAVCQLQSLSRLPSDCSIPETADPCESPACIETYGNCLQNDSVSNCNRALAGCLEAEEDFETDLCDLVPDESGDACFACDTVEPCWDLESDPDNTALQLECEAAQARCEWDEFGLLPGACEAPELSLGDPCLSLSCRTELDDCLLSADRDGCTREYASCLALEESFELPTCDVLPDSLQDQCRPCDDVPECQVVEDGADANACAAASALCVWDSLNVLPGACALPPELD